VTFENIAPVDKSETATLENIAPVDKSDPVTFENSAPVDKSEQAILENIAHADKSETATFANNAPVNKSEPTLSERCHLPTPPTQRHSKTLHSTEHLSTHPLKSLLPRPRTPLPVLTFMTFCSLGFGTDCTHFDDIVSLRTHS
jgi:hypothetical protein